MGILHVLTDNLRTTQPPKERQINQCSIVLRLNISKKIAHHLFLFGGNSTMKTLPTKEYERSILLLENVHPLS